MRPHFAATFVWMIFSCSAIPGLAQNDVQVESVLVSSSDPFLTNSQTFLNEQRQTGVVQTAYSRQPDSGERVIDVPEESIFGPFALSWTKHRLTTTFVAGADDGLGVTTVDLQTQLAPKVFPLVKATPRFTWHFLDRTDAIDLPSEIYETAVDFSLFLPFSEQWIFHAGIAPGLFTDFENTSSDAFRMPARAVMIYQRSENLTFAFGVVYLDRDDVSTLPAVGVIWKPQQFPNLTFDIMFPKPKIRYQLVKTDQIEKEIYLGGEFGGGTWAIQRRSGPNDVATYSELKLLVGFESAMTDGMAWFLEGGYVFNRSLEFPGMPEMDFSDTGMVRLGLRF